MKLIEMLKRNDPEAVVARLDAIYPACASSHEGHVKAYRELLTLAPVADDHGLIITVSLTEPDAELGIEAWWDVSGRKSGEEISYAIEFDRWPCWLGREVAHSDLPEVDLLAHILFEMTFMGYSAADVVEAASRLRARNEAALEGLDDV